MKLCDVRTNPGLMRGHGLIRGWAYPRDSTVFEGVERDKFNMTVFREVKMHVISDVTRNFT